MHVRDVRFHLIPIIYRKITKNETPYTLKNTVIKFGPERVHWGQTSFRVNDDLGQSDLFICQVCRKLTKFRVTSDPELSMTPIDPYLVTLTRVFFRVNLLRDFPTIIHPLLRKLLLFCKKNIICYYFFWGGGGGGEVQAHQPWKIRS